MAANCVYLRADRDRVGDLLQHLVTQLFSSNRPVKLIPEQCAQLLGQVSAVIAVDDISFGPDQVSYLLDMLAGCSVVLGLRISTPLMRSPTMPPRSASLVA